MKADFVVLAEKASQSGDKGLTIEGIRQRVFADSFPHTVHPALFLVFYSIDPLDMGRHFEFGIEVIDADANSIYKFPMPYSIDIPPSLPILTGQDVFYLNTAFMLPKAGRYEIVISLNGHPQITCPIDAFEKRTP